jgi:hypothetical protein
MGKLTPILELGVAEAYQILTEQLGLQPGSLPPLQAIENEDWGRDLLLSRFLEFPAGTLAAAGLCLDENEEATGHSQLDPGECL